MENAFCPFGDLASTGPELAKKNAEVMQSVGKETDIGYLNEKGITLLAEENIEILNEIYNIELNCGREHKKLNDLNI